jgi:hypothetical protein
MLVEFRLQKALLTLNLADQVRTGPSSGEIIATSDPY